MAGQVQVRTALDPRRATQYRSNARLAPKTARKPIGSVPAMKLRPKGCLRGVVVEGIHQRAGASCSWPFAGLDEAVQGDAHGGQFGDAPVEILQPARGRGPGHVAGLRASVAQVEELGHVIEGEPEFLCALDEPHDAFGIRE